MSNNKLLIEHIQKLKPKLKINSIQTYITNLYKICRELEGKPKKYCDLGDLSFLNNFDAVMKTIKDETLNTRKNRLIAIVVSLKAIEGDKELIEKYSEQMTKLAEESEERVKRQKLTDKQRENWVSYDELIALTEKLFDEIKKEEILKKEKLTRGEYTLLQDYILLRTYLTFTWRNDFADMKVIKSERQDDNKENFLLIKKGVPDKFILNQYKTDSRYGKKSVKIPSSLSKVIKKFLKFNKSGYFLTLQDGIRPINSNGITKALNRLFEKHLGKTIGSSLLRHIVISHFRQNDPTIKQMEEKNKEIEDKFMHSASMNDQYRKID
jgi:ribosomal protein S17E